MKPETLAKIEELIYRADQDECSRINTALRLRYKTLRQVQVQMTLTQLHVNDRVILDNIKPQYLIGHTATVTRIRQTKVEVELENPVHKSTGRLMRYLVVPASCIHKID